MNNDEIKGKIKKAAGHVKDAVGGLTGDSKTQGEGKMDELKGDVQEKVGEARRKVGEHLEDLGENIKE